MFQFIPETFMSPATFRCDGTVYWGTPDGVNKPMQANLDGILLEDIYVKNLHAGLNLLNFNWNEKIDYKTINHFLWLNMDHDVDDIQGQDSSKYSVSYKAYIFKVFFK